MNHARIFRSDAYLHVTDCLRKKHNKKSEKLIMVGYNDNSANYRLYNTVTKKIKVSDQVIFNENCQVNLPEKNTVFIEINAKTEENVQEKNVDILEVENQETDNDESFSDNVS